MKAGGMEQRLKFWRTLAIASTCAVALILVAGLLGVFMTRMESVRAREAESRARMEEEAQRAAAVSAQREAEQQRSISVEQRDRAKKAEAEAKQRADELKQVADCQADLLGRVSSTPRPPSGG